MAIRDIERVAAELRGRVRAYEMKLQTLDGLLRQAMMESHHTDGCAVRYRETCTCWKGRAKAALSPRPPRAQGDSDE